MIEISMLCKRVSRKLREETHGSERDGAVMALRHRPTDRIEVDKEAGPVARLAVDDLAPAERDTVSVIRDHGQVTDAAGLV